MSIIERAFYSDQIDEFRAKPKDEILGQLVRRTSFSVDSTQRDAWIDQIVILQSIFGRCAYRGKIYFEYSVPRLGKRIDVVALIGHVIFVLEFKVGESEFSSAARDQVWDYALDLKSFHETSHDRTIAPILIATRSTCAIASVSAAAHADKVLAPMNASAQTLGEVISAILAFTDGVEINAQEWERGRYCTTPTIIEAATALYRGHSVADISRSDASAINLSQTSGAISQIISTSKEMSRKAMCFVTGVPGAGKTLVGLDIATKHIDKSKELYSVFLSGNGPLVAILREALAHDKVRQEREHGRKLRKGVAMSEVKLFVQNVHHFRDECLADVRAPIEHVALFDEASTLGIGSKRRALCFARRSVQISINPNRSFSFRAWIGIPIGP